MLANGAKLSVDKERKGTAWTLLKGLKEIPDMGVDPEKVENTTLDDSMKQYELGIGDAGDITYKFKYDNNEAGASYRILREIEKTKKTVDFKEELKDGTITKFSGQVSVKRNGGGVNAALEFQLTIALQSNIEVTDPVGV